MHICWNEYRLSILNSKLGLQQLFWADEQSVFNLRFSRERLRQQNYNYFHFSQRKCLMKIRDEFGGGPQNFWSFMSPHKGCFIAFLRKNFRKFSKFGVLCPPIFFEKFPKISKKFPEIFSIFAKSKKTTVFVTKSVRNDYIDQNLVKISHKTPKHFQFSLWNLFS